MFPINAERLQQWRPHQTILDYELTDPDAVARSILRGIDGRFDFRIEFEGNNIVVPMSTSKDFLRQIDEMIPIEYAGDFYYYAEVVGLVGFSSLRDSFGVFASRGSIQFASRKVATADKQFAERFLRTDSDLGAEGRAYFDTLLRLLPKDRYQAIGNLGS